MTGSARQPRSFCFGKRTQNHVGRGVALRVPCAVRRLRRRANSLRSNSACLFPGVACTARPHHKARRDAGIIVPKVHLLLMIKTLRPHGENFQEIGAQVLKQLHQRYFSQMCKDHQISYSIQFIQLFSCCNLVSRL